MSRQMIEVKVDAHTDVFRVESTLKEFSNVKPYIISVDSLRIYYYDEKISLKDLISLINTCSKKKTASNILHLIKKSMSDE